MNIKEIKEMIAIMNENGIIELEIEKDGMRVKLKKAGATELPSSGPIMIEKERISEFESKEKGSLLERSASKNVEIKAPMVGTFYRAPAPEAPPYIEVGQVIEPGQVICVIEAMKLMNEIKSEIKGKLLEILVDNTEPVEFGQPIFLIEPL